VFAVMDSATSEADLDVVSDNGSVHDANPPTRSELLCFLRRSIIPFDDLVKLCCDFYSEDEITAARNIIAVWHKLPKRKGADKSRSTMEDILKCILNPVITLPVFYAVDLTRLPPTDVKHCGMSAVIIELQALRNEMKDMKRLQKKDDDLRDELHTMQLIT